MKSKITILTVLMLAITGVATAQLDYNVTLNNPDSGDYFNVAPDESAEIQFNYSVEAGEKLNTTIHVNNTVYGEYEAVKGNNTFTENITLEKGTYDWYVTLERNTEEEESSKNRFYVEEEGVGTWLTRAVDGLMDILGFDEGLLDKKLLDLRGGEILAFILIIYTVIWLMD